MEMQLILTLFSGIVSGLTLVRPEERMGIKALTSAVNNEIKIEENAFDAIKKELRLARPKSFRKIKRALIHEYVNNAEKHSDFKRETHANNNAPDDKTQHLDDIFQACERNDLEKVKNFVEVQNVPLTSRNHDDETPAHSAAKNGHMPVLKYVLEKHSDLQNAKDIQGNNILHLAAMCGSLEMVKYLIDERGMDIYEPASAHLGNGAAHMSAFAGWLPLVKYFVEEKLVDVNLRNRIGQPLAFAAALNRKLKVIKYLLEERNANLFMTDDNAYNILLICASVGDLSIPIYLLETMKMKYNVDGRDRNGRTVLHHAARRDQLVVLKYFVRERRADFNAQDLVGRSPLHEAAERNNLKMVEYLMEHGASVFVEDKFKRTPLHVAKDKRIIQYLEQYVPPE